MLSKESKAKSKKQVASIKKFNKEIQMYTKSLDDDDLAIRLNAQRKILLYQRRVNRLLSSLCDLIVPITVPESIISESIIEYVNECNGDELVDMAKTAFGGEWYICVDGSYKCMPDESYVGTFHPKKEKL